MTYSHMANATLPSAMLRFTSEFGKGSGGSRVLWSSGVTGNAYHAEYCVIVSCPSAPWLADTYPVF